MMSHLNVSRPTVSDHEGTLVRQPKHKSLTSEMAARVRNLGTATCGAFAMRVRTDVCCSIATAHLVRGYLSAPSNADITALLGNAIWEATVPSRSAFTLSAVHWVARQCPALSPGLAQKAATLTTYVPALELFVRDPYLEMVVIGALITAPSLLTQVHIPTKYQTAVQLGAASLLHVACSSRKASIVGAPAQK